MFCVFVHVATWTMEHWTGSVVARPSCCQFVLCALRLLDMDDLIVTTAVSYTHLTLPTILRV